jgi:predicted PurR-regulated permease PerM/methylmalonyl-CoA mutase cobalamin-binding subunit
MTDESTNGQPLGNGAARPEQTSRNGMQPLIVASAVIAGLYFGRPVLEPLALAVLLSLMLVPLVRWLSHRIGRVAAVLTSVLAASILLLGVLAALTEQAIELIENLPRYEENIAAKIRSLGGGASGAGMLDRATQVFQDLLGQFSDPTGRGAPASASNVSSDSPPPVPVVIQQRAPGPLDILKAVVGPMLYPIVHAGLVVFLVILILLQREDLRDRVLRLAGAHDLHRTTAAMNEATERISQYLLMQLGAGLCFGIPFGIGLAAIGIPNAPLWGMLGVIFRFIPYIGGPLTAIFPIMLAIAVDPGWGLLLWTVLLFVAIELLVANVVETLIYSRSTGLSAVAVVAAALFWTWLWGGSGLLLATPMTVCLVVFARYIRPLQFLDILLGNRPVLSPQESLYQRLLARNPEEATEQAEEYARETSIEAFFDTVAIPALIMAQADTDRGVLTPHQRAIIAEGFDRLLDNLAESGSPEQHDLGPDGDVAPTAVIAARNELDLAAAKLLAYLLRQRGLRARVHDPELLASFAVEDLPLRDVSVICLSVLSASSAAQLRYLVRRLRRRGRQARIVIGHWDRRDDAGFSLAEATAAAAADQVVTSLPAALAAIEAALVQKDNDSPNPTPNATGRTALISP